MIQFCSILILARPDRLHGTWNTPMLSHRLSKPPEMCHSMLAQPSRASRQHSTGVFTAYHPNSVWSHGPLVYCCLVRGIKRCRLFRILLGSGPLKQSASGRVQTSIAGQACHTCKI